MTTTTDARCQRMNQHLQAAAPSDHPQREEFAWIVLGALAYRLASMGDDGEAAWNNVLDTAGQIMGSIRA